MQASIILISFLYLSLVEFRFFANSALSAADFLFPILFLFLIFHLKFITFKNIPQKALLALFVGFWILSVYPTSEPYYLTKILVSVLMLAALAATFCFSTLKLGTYLTQLGIVTAGVSNGLLALLGFFLYLKGIDNRLVCFDCTSSPYLKTWPRFIGFSLTPNGFAFLIMISIGSLLFIWDELNKLVKYTILIFLCFCLFMTFTKLLIPTFTLIVLWWFKRFFPKYKIVYFSLILCAFMGYIALTHFVPNNADGHCTYGIESNILNTFPFNTQKICPSYFVDLKVKYAKIATQYWPTGTGADNEEVINTNAHSTFFERIAIHGVVGFFSWLFLIILVFKLLKYIKINPLINNFSYNSLELTWIVILMESINNDLMRFRLLWVILGLTVAIASHTKIKSKNTAKEIQP